MKKKFDEFVENCAKHPVRNIIILFLALAVLPTFFIHLVYTLPHMFKGVKVVQKCAFFKSYFFKAKIPAGNLLAYIGTVLTFCATFPLSVMVYLSNKKQTERMQIIDNKALFLVDNTKKVNVQLLNPQKEKLDDIFIMIKWNVLSDAIISKIVIKCLTIEDLGHPRERNKQFFADYGKGKSVIFKYLGNKNNIELTLNLRDEKAQKILRKDPWIGISGDFDVYCENVKTPVTMSINCWSYRPCEDVVADMEYVIRDSNFFSHKAELL